MNLDLSKRISLNKYRWVMWSVMALAFLVVFFHRYSLLVVVDTIGAELELTGTQIGNLASMYFYIYAILQIPAGIMADTIGARKLTSFGLSLAGILGIIMSFSSTWGVQYLMQVYGFSRDAAANYVLIFTMGVLVGSPVMGRVADKLGRRKPLIQLGAAAYTLVWGLKVIGYGSNPPEVLLPFIYFIAGFFGIFLMLSHASLKESNPTRFTGTALSIINTAPFVGTVAMNFLAGGILDYTWTGMLDNGARFYELSNYHYAFLAYFTFSLISLAATFFIKDTRVK